MSWLRREEDGSAAAELAFVAPILALLVAGIIQVATIVQAGLIASNAAREGARYAAVRDPNAAANALDYLQQTLGSRTDITLPAVGSITVSDANPTNPVGSSVTVSVPLKVSIGMPVMRQLFGSTLTMTGSAVMEVSQ